MFRFLIVEQRYKNGLSLIKRYYARFNEITFIDNSRDTFQTVLLIQNGIIVHQADFLPNWVEAICQHIQLRQRLIS